MNLIEELTALQEQNGSLRDEDLLALSQRLRVPLHEIQGLCSFYPHFRREPRAPLELKACRDLACHLRDGGASLAALRDRCAARDDVRFETVSCLGRCDMAPACALNEVPLEAAEAEAVLDGSAPAPSFETFAARAGAEPERRFALDPHPRAADHYGVVREWLAGADGRERAADLVARLEASGLRGMGGSGFPTGRKWKLVAAQSATPRTVICNADESEPGTFKDRALLADAPHLVLEGMLLAGLAVGSHEGIVYIRHEYEPERRRLAGAIERARAARALGASVFGSGFAFDVRIFVSPGGYVLGEETALLEALEGRRGEPRNKPPYPGVRGLYGRPTLINNVETFAQVPGCLRTGTVTTKLFSVSGDVKRPAVVDAPIGTTLHELVARCGGMRQGRRLLAFLPGGASTGFLPAAQADLPLDWEPLREAGSALGSAAVLVVAEGADLLALAGNLTAFFRNESCGKCVPCRIGTEKAVALIERREPAGLARLHALHEAMAATSICGLGQAALKPVLSVLEGFDASGRGAA